MEDARLEEPERAQPYAIGEVMSGRWVYHCPRCKRERARMLAKERHWIPYLILHRCRRCHRCGYSWYTWMPPGR